MTSSQLQSATRAYTEAWDRLRSHWHDVKSVEFYNNYVKPAPESVRRASPLLDELEARLKNLRDDCKEDV